jgi:hypothetical protein
MQLLKPKKTGNSQLTFFLEFLDYYCSAVMGLVIASSERASAWEICWKGCDPSVEYAANNNAIAPNTPATAPMTVTTLLIFDSLPLILSSFQDTDGREQYPDI